MKALKIIIISFIFILLCNTFGIAQSSAKKLPISVGKCDLAIQQARVLKNTSTTNRIVTIESIMANVSHIVSRPTGIFYTISKTAQFSKTSKVIKAGSLKSLNSRQTIKFVERIVLPDNINPGTYFIQVKIGTKGNNEITHRNNVKTVKIYVSQRPVTNNINFDLSFADKPTALVQTAANKTEAIIQLKAVVVNRGTHASTPTTVSMNLVENPKMNNNAVQLRPVPVKRLQPGESFDLMLALSVNRQALATHSFLKLMIKNQPGDVNPRNNIVNVRLNSNSQPAGNQVDLSLIGGLKLNKHRVVAGEVLLLKSILANQANFKVAGSEITFLISKHPGLSRNDQIIGKVSIPLLQANQTQLVAHKFNVPNVQPGPYYIHAVCKTKNVKEVNWKNNKTSAKILVGKKSTISMNSFSTRK